MKKSDKLRAALEGTAISATETLDPPAAAEAVPPPIPRAAFNAILLPVAKIRASPTNPRTRFDAAAQTEIENSLRAHGFTRSALLVRPSPIAYWIDAGNDESQSDGQFFVMSKTRAGVESAVEMLPSREQAETLLATLAGGYELVAGERRWRAAKAVGIEQAPCIVEEMDDRQVLEFQLVENIQRLDLSPMEEAMGFRRLLALADADGKPVHTIKGLATITGKGLDHVERRVKIARLSDVPGLAAFVKAFESGVVGLRHALLVAAIPDEKARGKFAQEILAPKYEDAPLSVAKAEALKQRDYAQPLRDAPFDLADATLVPVVIEAGERVRGGACLDCPFMELAPGNMRMCLNPPCFAVKKEQGWKQWQASESDPKKKRAAADELTCRKLYQHGDDLAWNCGYVDLGERPDGSDLKAGQPSPGTWKKLIGNAEIEVLVARDRNNRRHELVDRKLAMLAAKANGFDVFKETKQARETQPELEDSTSSLAGAVKRQTADTDEQRAARAREQANEEEIDTEVMRATAAAVAEKASTGKALPAGFWVEVMQVWRDDFYGEAPDILESRRGWKNGSLVSEMKKLQGHHQIGVIAEFLYLDAEERHGTGSKNLLKILGVDPKAVDKAATARVRGEQKRRGEIRKEIDKLAGQLNLAPKNLDAMALNTPAAMKYGSLNHTASLEALLVALAKMSGAPGAVKAAKVEPSPKAKAAITPEGRAKMAAAVKARWAKKKAGAK